MAELVGLSTGTKVLLVQGDITGQDTCVIVNAANSGLLGGGGVDGAIHRAGGPSILDECRKIRAEEGQCRPGDAVITGGGDLKARFVVHAVGPIWRGGGSDEAKTLASAYKNSLKLACGVGARSVSFPSISTGAYGYPLSEASEIAINSVQEFLRENKCDIEEIYFVLFDGKTYEFYKEAAKRVFI